MKLRIKQVEKREGKDDRDKERKKTDRDQVSRARNKQRKKEAKLEKELKETQAIENQDDRLHFNSQTIEAVFGIFFRILKSARNGPLLSSVLLGITKYGHLINIDLIGPLLSLLGDVLADKNVPLHNRYIDINFIFEFYHKLFGSVSEKKKLAKFEKKFRLKSAKSAATILSGEGEVLLVDPRQLYLHTYQIMNKIKIEVKPKKDPDEGNEQKQENKNTKDKSDPWPALFEVLWALMIDRKSHLNGGRVNAFLHRNSLNYFIIINSNNYFKFS